MYSGYSQISRPDPAESLVLSLRELYSSFGYKRYRMSKFEDYDYYSRNKDFLVSDRIITFTDTNGKLMALKPDVTLSIIRNAPDNGSVSKLFYDENVYRVSGGSGTFREIRQAGLECIGTMDPYCFSEVLYLASRSLSAVSADNSLVVSHIGILTKFARSVSNDPLTFEKLIKCAKEKNLHEIDYICNAERLPSSKADAFKKLLSLYGAPYEVLDGIGTINDAPDVSNEVMELKNALKIFDPSEKDDRVVVDFSVVGDIDYYSGIVFKGYIDKVPGSILSGGCYDTLMNKLGRNSRAIGFAVYIGMLDHYLSYSDEFDADVLLIYGSDPDPVTVKNKVEEYAGRRSSVYCSAAPIPGFRCREVLDLRDVKPEG